MLLAGHRLVSGDDLGRDPAALFDLNPVCLGPGAYLGVADVVRGGLAPVLPCLPGGCGGPPAGVDVAGQGGPQLRGVVCAQVNLVLRSVQPENDCAFCFAAVEVVDEEGLYFFAMPVSVLCESFPLFPIVRHRSLARRIRWPLEGTHSESSGPQWLEPGSAGLVNGSEWRNYLIPAARFPCARRSRCGKGVLSG